MAMEDIELDVGGTKFKGVWIAILFSFASTIGGGIWAASEFFSRLEAQEDAVVQAENSASALSQRFDDLKENNTTSLNNFSTRVGVVEDKLQAVNIDQLQGQLAKLGTNLEAIMKRQEELLLLQERVIEVEKLVTEMKTTVRKAEIATKDSDQIKEKLDRILKEIDDLWDGLDFLSNPL